MPTDRCVVFDLDGNEAFLREERAIEALELLAEQGVRLHDGGPLGAAIPVGIARTRSEVQTAAANATSSLLLLDMTQPPYAGNVGARVARAIASRPEVAAKTWRVIWTRHHWTEIFGGLDGYVHSIVRYEPAGTNLTELCDGIAHAISQPPAAREDTVAFPAVRTPTERTARLEEAIQELAGECMRGDIEIAAAICHNNVLDSRINAQLAQIGPPRRESVQSFLQAIKDNNRATSKQHARDRVREECADWVVADVMDRVTPSVADAACRALEQGGGMPVERLLDQTWLLPDELSLARAFREDYRPRVENAHVGSESHWRAVNEAMDSVCGADAGAILRGDLSYTLHSLSDWLLET